MKRSHSNEDYGKRHHNNTQCTPTTPPYESLSQMQQNMVAKVDLLGFPITALLIEDQERLCLAQISNTLLKQYSYNEVHNRRVALGINCVQCTPVQLEVLRRVGAMPVSSRRCGMITKKEAERLCKSFLTHFAPPKLPQKFFFHVTHKCAWGCKGFFVPSRYNSSRAKCIQCTHCLLYFSPNKFIFHSHRFQESVYTQPDAANFNNWRRHLNLTGSGNIEEPGQSDLGIDALRSPGEETASVWEDVKAMFNGGTRKRFLPIVLRTTTSSSQSSDDVVASDDVNVKDDQENDVVNDDDDDDDDDNDDERRPDNVNSLQNLVSLEPTTISTFSHSRQSHVIKGRHRRQQRPHYCHQYHDHNHANNNNNHYHHHHRRHCNDHYGNDHYSKTSKNGSSDSLSLNSGPSETGGDTMSSRSSNTLKYEKLVSIEDNLSNVFNQGSDKEQQLLTDDQRIEQQNQPSSIGLPMPNHTSSFFNPYMSMFRMTNADEHHQTASLLDLNREHRHHQSAHFPPLWPTNYSHLSLPSLSSQGYGLPFPMFVDQLIRSTAATAGRLFFTDTIQNQPSLSNGVYCDRNFQNAMIHLWQSFGANQQLSSITTAAMDPATSFGMASQTLKDNQQKQQGPCDGNQASTALGGQQSVTFGRTIEKCKKKTQAVTPSRLPFD